MKSPLVVLGLLLSVAGAAPARSLEKVHDFYGPMPTGVTVSHTGRIFVCYPHWGDPVTFTVGEIKDGQEVAYPNAAINRLDKAHPSQCLYSVQSVVVDPRDRLWAQDTGSIKLGRNVSGGPQLVGIDLTTNTVFKTIYIPRTVALKYTYLNDVRFDLRRGKAGLAYITDSGVGGLIMVDLASGRSWRHLTNSPTVKKAPGFSAIVNGLPLRERLPGNKPKVPNFLSDGLAISHDGKTIFYCPIASRRLYGVSTDALADPSKSEADVAATVKDFGAKPGASDGIEGDAEGGVYVSDDEHDSMERFSDGAYKVVLRSPSLLWPDSIALGPGGYVYVTSDQLNRQGKYHRGKNIQQRPFSLWRVKTGDKPVFLK